MIQRIQSAFLLLVTALMVVVWFVPFGIFRGDYGVIQYSIFEVNQIKSLILPEFPLIIPAILTIITALFSFAAVFMYKNRKLQIHMCIDCIILLVALYGVSLAYIFSAINKLSFIFHPSFVISLPGIGIALFLLAIIFIKKDEKLVKSTDRIR